jgi:hypothetical protein
LDELLVPQCRRPIPTDPLSPLLGGVNGSPTGGHVVTSDLDERILGISAETMRSVPRRVGVAGSEWKYTAIRAALCGGWINVLITDRQPARRRAGSAAGRRLSSTTRRHVVLPLAGTYDDGIASQR